MTKITKLKLLAINKNDGSERISLSCIVFITYSRSTKLLSFLLFYKFANIELASSAATQATLHTVGNRDQSGLVTPQDSNKKKQ